MRKENNLQLPQEKQEQEQTDQPQPVECLGMTFPSDQERRNYFLDKLSLALQELREKLEGVPFSSQQDTTECLESLQHWPFGQDSQVHELARKMAEAAGNKHRENPVQKHDLLQLFKDEIGFPHGNEEDILALSDPPYYTACPNPFIPEFISQHGKPYDPETDNYHREPFAADVSEGKNDPIYNAHSYHTKVPHKAIMRYILHYTEPGDVVFDGFCGTGMTGVAAKLCGDRKAVSKLGLSITEDGKVMDENSKISSQVGERFAVLNDLSSAATLISAGYNLKNDPKNFTLLAKEILDKFNEQYGWMYETFDPETGDVCTIDFTIWSEVFSCPYCSGDLEYWSVAYDKNTGKMNDNISCTHCNASLSKRELIRRTTTYYDKGVKRSRTRQLLRPVEIRYKHQGAKKTKEPDKNDFWVLGKIESLLEHLEYPTELMMFVPEGEEWGDLYRGYHEGISRVHDFHLPRQLAAFSVLWKMTDDLPQEDMRRLWRFTLQSVLISFTRRNRFLKNAYSQVNRALSGTLYISSTISEPSPSYVLSGKIKRFVNAFLEGDSLAYITTQSLSSVHLPENSIDYVFIDPPFGNNLPYAELNFLWEAWLRVFTNSDQDTIVSNKQRKDLSVYTDMMTDCLKHVYRVLKPGRWVTIEFHNSQNAVWTAIQEALGRANFIIADVSVLDKGMKTKKQMHSKAVHKDLVISAYKPNGGLEKKFQLQAGSEGGVWEFVRHHLKQLPIFVTQGDAAEAVTERQSHLLFDRMIAFHVQRGVSVPMSAAEFYQGLAQRFDEREGMYFLPEQAAEYDRKRKTVKEFRQLSLMVIDEASAIQWLKQQLLKKPQTFQELHPQFMKEIQGWQKHEKMLELSDLLEQNFLIYYDDSPIPAQIVSWMKQSEELRGIIAQEIEAGRLREDHGALHIEHTSSVISKLISRAQSRWYVPNPHRAADLEKLREKSLLKEFEEYKQFKGRKMKQFRLEAVRAGFKKAWQERDYQTIISIAKKIPEKVLQEDQKLLMWYDQAVTRVENI